MYMYFPYRLIKPNGSNLSWGRSIIRCSGGGGGAGGGGKKK